MGQHVVFFSPGDVVTPTRTTFGMWWVTSATSSPYTGDGPDLEPGDILVVVEGGRVGQWITAYSASHQSTFLVDSRDLRRISPSPGDP